MPIWEKSQDTQSPASTCHAIYGLYISWILGESPHDRDIDTSNIIGKIFVILFTRIWYLSQQPWIPDDTLTTCVKKWKKERRVRIFRYTVELISFMSPATRRYFTLETITYRNLSQRWTIGWTCYISFGKCMRARVAITGQVWSTCEWVVVVFWYNRVSSTRRLYSGDTNKYSGLNFFPSEYFTENVSTRIKILQVDGNPPPNAPPVFV